MLGFKLIHVGKRGPRRPIYSQVPLQSGPIYHDITYVTAITVAESETDFRITAHTAYLALRGELWGVFCEDFGEKWPRYNSTALYMSVDIVICSGFA